MKWFVSILLVLTIAGCQAAPEATATETPADTATATEALPTATLEPTATLKPSSTPEPTATATMEPTATPSGQIYLDEGNGFSLIYPEGWSYLEVAAGARGTIITFASWDITMEQLETTPEGEYRFDLSVLQWEPLDLDAYVENRKLAFEASGISILEEENIELDNGLSAVEFLVEGPDGSQNYLMVSLVGEHFIGFSTGDNFDMVAQIAHTLQQIQS